MKRTLELALLLLVLLLPAFYAAAQQSNDQTPRPTSPQDRVAPTGEINGKPQPQPIALKVVGANLRDNEGAPLGRVEDLIIDPSSGRIEFLIVSTFYPTNSTKLTPIPWKAITPRTEQDGLRSLLGNQVFALNFPRTKLQQAPAFERFRWPDMSQSAWRQPVYQFYAVREANAAGSAGNETETQAGVGTGVGPNTSTGPRTDPSLPAGVSRTNLIGPPTNVLPRIPAAPGIDSSSGARTNAPADLRN